MPYLSIFCLNIQCILLFNKNQQALVTKSNMSRYLLAISFFEQIASILKFPTPEVHLI